MCFFDVHETYFDAYRNVMNHVYKDPHGKICIYTEMKKTAVYHTPYYSSEDQQHICQEARKFVMRSDGNWTKTSTLVRNYGRSPVQVTYWWKYIVSK